MAMPMVLARAQWVFALVPRLVINEEVLMTQEFPRIELSVEDFLAEENSLLFKAAVSRKHKPSTVRGI